MIGRRVLSFATLDEIMPDVDRLRPGIGRSASGRSARSSTISPCLSG